MRRNVRSGLAAALVLLAVLTGPARAATVTLDAPGAPDDLRAAITGASLLMAAQTRGVAATAEPVVLLAEGRADYARILAALYAAGRYGAIISITADGREVADLAPFDAPARIAAIRIAVEPGPAFTLGQARIAPLAPGTTPAEGFAPGAPAGSGTIAQAAREGIDGWRDAGHAKATLARQSLVADHRTARLDADLSLAPGPRLRFGPLSVEGESRVRPERIRAIAGLPVGQVYSPKALADASARLRATGTFRSARLVEAESPEADGTLPITAAITDERRRRLGFGGEVATDDGVALSALWLNRNLLGGAERLRFDAAITGIGGTSGGADYRLSARFDRPATLRPDTGFFASAVLAREDSDDYHEDSLRLGAGLTRRFSDRREASAGVELWRSQVRDDLGERGFNILAFPVSATHDARNDPLDTSAGHYAALTVSPLLAGDDGESGLWLSGDLRVYRGLGAWGGAGAGGGEIVLAGRAQIGSLLGARASGVPPQLLFFSGGGGTVRGQPYESLAVETDAGDMIGGRGFFALSGEARVPIRGAFSGVAFVDAGHVGSAPTPTTEGEWHAGAGLGLRYATGLGPIRLDIAAPVRGRTGAGVQLYLGIGQAF